MKWSACRAAWIGATSLKPAAISASRKSKKYVFYLKSDTVDPMVNQKQKPLVQDFALKWKLWKLQYKITKVIFEKVNIFCNSNVYSKKNRYIWWPFSHLLVKVPRSRGTFGLDDRFEEEISTLCKGERFFICVKKLLKVLPILKNVTFSWRIAKRGLTRVGISHW